MYIRVYKKNPLRRRSRESQSPTTLGLNGDINVNISATNDYQTILVMYSVRNCKKKAETGTTLTQ
jgi:hypothetical protein